MGYVINGFVVVMVLSVIMLVGLQGYQPMWMLRAFSPRVWQRKMLPNHKYVDYKGSELIVTKVLNGVNVLVSYYKEEGGVINSTLDEFYDDLQNNGYILKFDEIHPVSVLGEYNMKIESEEGELFYSVFRYSPLLKLFHLTVNGYMGDTLHTKGRYELDIKNLSKLLLGDISVLKETRAKCGV